MRFAATVIRDPSSEFQRQALAVLAKLTPEQWQLMEEMARKLLQEQAADSPQPKESPTGRKIRERRPPGLRSLILRPMPEGAWSAEKSSQSQYLELLANIFLHFVVAFFSKMTILKYTEAIP